MFFRDMIDKTICLLKTAVKKRVLLYEICRVISGVAVYKTLQRRFGNVHIVLIRGASGDVYIQYGLLDAYLSQNSIKNFAIAGDGLGIIPLGKMYAHKAVLLSTRASEHLERAYLFLNGKGMNIVFPFRWSDSFSMVNKCRIRMLERYDFMDTYSYFSFNLSERTVCQLPNLVEADEQNILIWQQKGIIKGQTVLLSPDANSITCLPIWFWNGIIRELRERGYTVFVNCNYQTYFRAPNLFSPWNMSVQMLECCGSFLGARSGFCDIISSAKCKKVIIYPAIQKNVNYSFHRSEAEFSSLEKMGLSSADNLVELSTPLLQNITDKETMLTGTEHFVSSLEKLRKEILEQFPTIREEREI